MFEAMALKQMVDMIKAEGAKDRKQLVLLATDGNPLLNGHEISVCYLNDSIFEAGIFFFLVFFV